MSLDQIPIGIIVLVIGQTGTTAWALIKLYFSHEAMKIKVKEIEEAAKAALAEVKEENKTLRSDIRKLSDTLLLVQHSVDLLVIGKLKTGNQK